MNNYFHIGEDGLVPYNLHKAGESPFYLVSSHLVNKFIYFSYGQVYYIALVANVNF